MSIQDHERAARELKNAIIRGDKKQANKAVLELMKKHGNVKIDTTSSYVPTGASSNSVLQKNERILIVKVECLEKQFEKKLMLPVTPETKIKDLKDHVHSVCKIKPCYQFWICAQNIMLDHATLGNCKSDDIVLYISANSLTEEECNK